MYAVQQSLQFSFLSKKTYTTIEVHPLIRKPPRKYKICPLSSFKKYTNLKKINFFNRIKLNRNTNSKSLFRLRNKPKPQILNT